MGKGLGVLFLVLFYFGFCFWVFFVLFFHFSSQVYFLVPQDIRTEGDRLIACFLYLALLHVFYDLIKEAKLICKCCVCLSSEKTF